MSSIPTLFADSYEVLLPEIGPQTSLPYAQNELVISEGAAFDVVRVACRIGCLKLGDQTIPITVHDSSLLLRSSYTVYVLSTTIMDVTLVYSLGERQLSIVGPSSRLLSLGAWAEVGMDNLTVTFDSISIQVGDHTAIVPTEVPVAIETIGTSGTWNETNQPGLGANGAGPETNRPVNNGTASLEAGAIAGIVVGGIFVLGTLMTAVFCLLRRKREARHVQIESASMDSSQELDGGPTGEINRRCLVFEAQGRMVAELQGCDVVEVPAKKSEI